MEALVEGKQFAIPQDLYIPPDALQVFLETTFEGPLDLLLYLIRRHNLDILNINVSVITDQYIAYIELMDAHQFELAGEYLVMAAMLAEIKSRSLLPRQQAEEEDEEDPRARLIRQLQEYERFKNAAERVDELPRMGRDNFHVHMDMPDVKQARPHPHVDMAELLDAYRQVLKRCDLYEHHHITREALSTRERMTSIMERLQDERVIDFQDLFEPEEGRMGVVVSFLAMMELVKEKLVQIVQAQQFGPIHVSLGGYKDSPNQEMPI
jgi:segregation and condensation protein A